MNVESIDARLRQIAMEAGLRLKPLSAEWLRNRVLNKLSPDAAPAAIRAVIREAASERPEQFFNSPEAMLELVNRTASERLEEGNRRNAAERESAKRAADAQRPKVTLSERELKLPPEVRLSLIHEREAAALAAQKKNEESA
jgi:hypothetical protein